MVGWGKNGVMLSLPSITNNTCIYGIMDGLRPTATAFFNGPGMVYNNATNSFTYPGGPLVPYTERSNRHAYRMWPTNIGCRARAGVSAVAPDGRSYQTMATWLGGAGALSRNPAGSAMVARLYPGGHIQCCP
jgi:hypothetical protein